jgi:hypothetical protein
MPNLQALRIRFGRPHWVVVDEAHHMLHADWAPAAQSLPRQPGGMLYITVHPESMAPPALESVGVVLAVGESPERTLAAFCRVAGHPAPALGPTRLASGEALLWRRGATVVRLRAEPPKTERRRHSRKYAEGNLGPDRSFYFRGPHEKLNLRAQNLVTFLQLADGVDDETWTHHLKRGDYSAWFREGIKDDDLAAAVAEVEAQAGLTPAESRAAVREAIEQRYTLPADRPSGIT